MKHEIVRRRDLPHWDMPGAPFFVTSCLHDSIPAQGLLELAKYRAELKARSKPTDLSADAWQVQLWKLGFVRIENWLDHQPTNRALADPQLAQIVVDSFLHFAGERYDLFAYVVMPSHIHWLFQPLDAWVATLNDARRTPRERIVYSANRFTGNQCNGVLQRTGPFWQHEPYDHWVRNADELERIIRYIEENPVKAGLVTNPEDWKFASAWMRKKLGLEFGTPIRGSRFRS